MHCALVTAVRLFPLQTTPAAKRHASKVITILALRGSLTAGFGLSRNGSVSSPEEPILRKSEDRQAAVPNRRIM